MDFIDLFNQIKANYRNNEYKNTIQLLEQYVSLNNVGISGNILEIYINCQINLGLLDEARKNLEIMNKTFPNYYNNVQLALKYASCREETKLYELIKNNNFEENIYYIAKECFYNGLYDISKQLFENFLLICENDNLKETTKNFLKRIKNYKKNKDEFNEISYSYFKYQKQNLDAGHIVYVSKLRNSYKENLNNDDPKKDNRPYMIWKIIDNKIYAFPVSTQIKSKKKYILFKQDYHNRDFDRIIKDNLVCIKESDITKIIDKVKDKDYNEVIEGLYRSTCFHHNTQKKSEQIFTNTILKELDIKENDIIVNYDNTLKRKRFYFILKIDKKQKYKTIEVTENNNHEFEPMNLELISMNNKSSILHTIKLSNDQKDNLLKKIPDNFKGINMVGSIVYQNSKRLEIMIEQDEDYLCIDRTLNYPSPIITVEFIKKDIPLNIVEIVPAETYEKHLYMLKDFFKTNSHRVNRKKLQFLKQNKK